MLQVDPAISWAISLSVAALFAASAAHKLRDWMRFREVVRNYQLLPQRVVPAAAATTIALELSTALLILLVATRPIGALLAAGLLIAYATAMAINLGRGRVNLDCGCLGIGRRQAVRWWMVTRNMVIAAFALIAGQPLVARDGDRRRHVLERDALRALLARDVIHPHFRARILVRIRSTDVHQAVETFRPRMQCQVLHASGTPGRLAIRVVQQRPARCSLQTGCAGFEPHDFASEGHEDPAIPVLHRLLGHRVGDGVDELGHAILRDRATVVVELHLQGGAIAAE